MRILVFVFFAITIFFGMSCSNETTSKLVVDNRSPSTIDMVEKLAEIDEKIDPMLSTFQNIQRAKLFESQANSGDIGKDMITKMRSGFEYMNSNENQKALQIFNELYEKINGINIQNKEVHVFNVLGLRAMNYFRMGELENCMHNHNEASCILPFTDQSFHTKQNGSRMAIKDILKILKIKRDPNFVWLLNVAYMTLGEYPASVPKEYLVPISPPEKKDLIAPFKNIGSMVGIDDNKLCGSPLVDDFNGDGYYDIITSSWDLGDQVIYYQSNGDGTFDEVHEQAGLKGITGGLNMTHTDYNNDGHLDFLILRGAWLHTGKYPNSLLRNNGDGTFSDVTHESGIFSLHPTLSAAWADFNNDGFLDLFIANESFHGKEEHPCELYLNNQDGTFKSVGSIVGADKVGLIKGVALGDMDNDLDPDVYLTNLTGSNYFLRNDKSDNEAGFTLTDVMSSSNATGNLQSFPCWFYDYDNDGNLDIFNGGFSTRFYNNLSNQYLLELIGEKFEADAPKLYKNIGNGKFEDVSNVMGLNKACFIMGAGYGDMNNDGYLDLYFGTGEPDFKAVIPNRAFLNLNGKEYAEITSQSRLGHLQKGHGISFADLDFDGDQDIYAVMGGAYQGDVFFNALFENPGNGNQWMKIKLEGTKSNRPAIGARIELVLESAGKERSIHRHVSCGSSFGENPFVVELGFEKDEKVKELKLIWPSGIKQNFDTLKENTYYKIVESNNNPEVVDIKSFKFQMNHGGHHHHHH